MNVCLLCSTALPLVGGLEMVVHNLATALTELGHQVVVVTPRPSHFRVSDNYPYRVIRFGFKGYGRLKLPFILAVATLAYVVKRYKIDVIHVHNVFKPGSWAFYYRKINPGVPIIGTPHGDDVQITMEIQDGVRLDPRADKIVRRNLNAFQWVTSISPSLRSDLQELVTDQDRIIDVPNGVWVKDYQQDTNVARLRKSFAIPADSIAVISVGRNHPRKGFEFGIKALALLKKAGLNAVYILVGRSMEPIIEMARELDVADRLITPGQVDAPTVAHLLQAADIYLSPSIVESFGLTTVEAMSAGLPCVVTDIAGSRDLVSSGHGFLVPARDAEQMAGALTWLIENPGGCRDMGAKARLAAAHYDWLTVAGRYMDVYKRAIHG
jgi:glycosyltransferase involved in cell wall biosynthesis